MLNTQHEPASRRGVVIVAGGRSRRMGTDKAWLRANDEYLVQRIARIAQAAAPFVVVISSQGQALPPLSDGIVVLEDPPELAGRGPLAGVMTGLEAALQAGVALAYLGSVDAVGLTSEHIVDMLDRLDDDPKLDAVVPVTTSRQDGPPIVHALSGAVRVTKGLPAARRLLHEGTFAMRSLYTALETQPIAAADLPDPEALRSCNTPEEFSRALSRAKP